MNLAARQLVLPLLRAGHVVIVNESLISAAESRDVKCAECSCHSMVIFCRNHALVSSVLMYSPKT